jgi:hypothetical protein
MTVRGERPRHDDADGWLDVPMRVLGEGYGAPSSSGALRELTPNAQKLGWQPQHEDLRRIIESACEHFAHLRR